MELQRELGFRSREAIESMPSLKVWLMALRCGLPSQILDVTKGGRPRWMTAGLRWDAGALTVDPDFVHAGKNVPLAIAANVEVDTAKAIESLEMSFIPVMPRTISKKFEEPVFDLHLLTTFGRGGGQPVFVPALNPSMRPLKFMEFPLEARMKTMLLYRNSPLVVNVP